MASIYENKFFMDSGLVPQYTPLPTYSPVNIKPLYQTNQTTVSYKTTVPTITDDKIEDYIKTLATPEVQNSIANYYKNLGKQTAEASKYYEKANMANKIAGYTNIAQGAFDLYSTYNARNSVRLTNKQLDIQKDIIDLNIKNTETLLADRFRNSIADLQVMYAAKNVDISSQALRSEIVASGEDMGEDIANMHLQGSLQKKAINFQKSMNKAQQRRNEQQAWINFGANLAYSAMFLI